MEKAGHKCRLLPLDRLDIVSIHTGEQTKKSPRPPATSLSMPTPRHQALALLTEARVRMSHLPTKRPLSQRTRRRHLGRRAHLRYAVAPPHPDNVKLLFLQQTVLRHGAPRTSLCPTVSLCNFEGLAFFFAVCLFLRQKPINMSFVLFRELPVG